MLKKLSIVLTLLSFENLAYNLEVNFPLGWVYTTQTCIECCLCSRENSRYLSDLKYKKKSEIGMKVCGFFVVISSIN